MENRGKRGSIYNKTVEKSLPRALKRAEELGESSGKVKKWMARDQSDEVNKDDVEYSGDENYLTNLSDESSGEDGYSHSEEDMDFEESVVSEDEEGAWENEVDRIFLSLVQAADKPSNKVLARTSQIKKKAGTGEVEKQLREAFPFGDRFSFLGKNEHN